MDRSLGLIKVKVVEEACGRVGTFFFFWLGEIFVHVRV